MIYGKSLCESWQKIMEKLSTDYGKLATDYGKAVNRLCTGKRRPGGTISDISGKRTSDNDNKLQRLELLVRPPFCPRDSLSNVIPSRMTLNTVYVDRSELLQINLLKLPNSIIIFSV